MIGLTLNAIVLNEDSPEMSSKLVTLFLTGVWDDL